jgi:hypothetical protein
MNDEPHEAEVSSETTPQEVAQEELLARYQEQQERLSCSGCGETICL